MMTENPEFQTKRVQALTEIEEGKECVSQGDLSGAKYWFKKSMETLPTAEGFTFYAWMLSFDGKYDEAIDLCKKAIEIDEDFGNPYNDIGSYLIAKGDVDEAISWLERAKGAKRYEPRHYPYTNLGRIYMRKGWLKKARSEFEDALRITPNNAEILNILEALDRGLN